MSRAPSTTTTPASDLLGDLTAPLVSAAYNLSYTYEKSGPNDWVEPGSEVTIPTAAVWELCAGATQPVGTWRKSYARCGPTSHSTPKMNTNGNDQ